MAPRQLITRPIKLLRRKGLTWFIDVMRAILVGQSAPSSVDVLKGPSPWLIFEIASFNPRIFYHAGAGKTRVARRTVSRPHHQLTHLEKRGKPQKPPRRGAGSLGNRKQSPLADERHLRRRSLLDKKREISLEPCHYPSRRLQQPQTR